MKELVMVAEKVREQIETGEGLAALLPAGETACGHIYRENVNCSKCSGNICSTVTCN